MSYATLILGESGTGKTAALRNLDPANTLLIQPIRKPLPFRSSEWKEIKAKGDNGNIFVCNNASWIVEVMRRAPQEIIVIDDWQYILSFKYMHSTGKKMAQGEVFEFYKELGNDGFIIAEMAAQLAPNKRVYVMAHTTTDDFGNTRIKTLGKLLDEKIVIEGMFTTVLRTKIGGGKYLFTTQNSGSDTVKSPMGMFASAEIENDLKMIDETICEYYGIGAAENENAQNENQSEKETE